MSDTPEQRLATYDLRLVAVDQAIARMPPAAQDFAREWRRLIEMGGRLGPDGCALSMVEDFVAGIQGVVDAVWMAAIPKKATPDHVTRTGGW